MNQKILNPKQIEVATVQVTCGAKSGTAFFVVTEADKQILLTSEHNLPKGQPVKLYLNNKEVEAEILERISDRDVAILELKNKPAIIIPALPVKKIEIPYNENWETYGFPIQRVNSGGRYTGSISRTNDGTKWDVDLECEQYSNLKQFDGLSGAPLVMNGHVVGVIGYDTVGTLGATSINSIAEILNKHHIVVIIDKGHSIPDSIESDISDTTPNEEVLQKINDVIAAKIDGSYFLVSGSPGSGKTTIAAQLEFEADNHIISDRFFVKVPESEEIPTQIRATPDFFMRWVEEVCHRTLYNSPPPKPKAEKSLNDRIIEIHQAIQHLSLHYQQQKKIAFLIIDGLDDVSESKIENFLSVLPVNLPPNIKVIFSCTSKELLPNAFQTVIDTSKEIKVTPLSIQNAEKYLSEHVKERGLNANQISALAEKSEGHPLYLRYLTKYILGMDEIPSIDDWISSIPIIGGEIENYYNKIWLQINDHPDEIWLAATLSRLRVPVEKKNLSEIQPEATKHSFLSSFKKIEHLLRDNDAISIYHTSFSDFVNRKTDALDEQVHENISNYIQKHPLANFSLSEKVYHLAHGGEKSKKRALDECNQAWIDDCALNSINPDIVLVDVKNIIGLAAELGVAHKVISLLLLSQRVNFRYNTLFQENAIFLVNALLALGRPEEAIRYVVRNKTLITADEDALYLLQKFYEYDADEEAEILLNAINQTCRNIIENGFDTNSFSRFITLKFSAVTLSSNSDFENAYHEFDHIKKVTIKLIKDNGNPEETVHKFKDKVGSYNAGYFVWRFNIPPTTKKIEEELEKFKFDDRSSGFIALLIHQALEFQDKSPKIKTVNNIPAWIEDLEYVIDKYGTHPDYHFILLYILLGRSKRLDLIENLYKNVFPDAEEFDLRKENGVDLNHQSIHRFRLNTECLGYFDSDDKFPVLPHYGYSSNWEGNIKSVFKYLCFLAGKIKRYKIDGKNEEVRQLQSKLIVLIEKLIPNLRDRMHWKRSYALPELIYPVIYKSLIRLLADAFPDYIPVFVEQIVNKKSYQLGLYTEGYTDSLFVIARELAKELEHEVPAFKVAKVLEEHIVNTVENRWERNEYLLRLVELYALLRNHDKAKQVFKEMIDTSMGPSWYKEAQLGIINTAVSNFVPKDGNLSYLQKFAAHLHNASGEMTFQRYVKQQQEEFVGDLAKIGFLNKSIEYFKHLLLPDYQTIITDAESGAVDMPYTGEGYILGARAIEEQSGIMDMLRNIKDSGSFIVWGLSELFMLGDDRYIRGYAKIQAGILNHLENSEPGKLDIVFKRLARFVVGEISDEFRYEYLRELFSELSTSNFEKLKPYLDAVGMQATQPSKEEVEEERKPSTPTGEEKDPLDELIIAKDEAQRKIDTENKSGARKVIIDALQKVQDEKYGIWSFNYSNKIDDIRDLFAGTYNNSAEFIKDIKQLIINEPYFEEWVIADQIISLLRNINDEHEKQLILESVLEHINLMVRTDQHFYDRYDWMNKGANKVNTPEQDEHLLKFLIWFLNHPSLVMKNRVIETLVWLGSISPGILVRALMEEMLSDGYRISKELSASVIHQLSNLNPDGFAENLKAAFEERGKELLKTNHFMIREAILASLIELKNNGITYLDALIIKFEQTFASSNKSNGEIMFEEEYLEPISEPIYELNELNILTKQFAETLVRQVKTLTPLSIKDSQKASEYIDRSFNDHNDISLVSDFDTLLRYALNVAVYTCTTLNDREKVANILRFYQPTFPENKMTPQFNSSNEGFENAVKDFFDTGNIAFDKLLVNNELPLNYYTAEHSKSSHSTKEKIELTAYLIPEGKFSAKRHSYPRPTFAANGYPDSISDEEEDVIPLFIKSEYVGSITGSELVPDVMNATLGTLIPNLKDNTKSVYWRKGRNWDNREQGVAEKTGYYTTVTKDKIETLKSGYKLIWQIYYGYDSKYIDVFEQTQLIR
ncbi:serine protease [Chitinophaga nivalis]|uniref:Serine protease n=1 Tax=Chitinophaga nivalis TaxID=2991709 RepID=A0ABT3IJI9_9BACT|nr:serine protease [Chitinophaga nivalis]MCW3466196.1 serine protease [Chitinophaga nivalis]MCW3484113.1 serine protease [Chitinophaga nivalis]